MGRNTAPAIGLAALAVNPDDIVLVTTSDHVIRKQAAFEDAVAAAVRLAEAGNIVTFGIQPTYAETGFGYIEYTGSDGSRLS